MKPEPWFSLEHVAEHVGASQGTVHRWIRQRILSAHEPGHLWKSEISEMGAWIRDGKANAGREHR